MYLGLWFLSQPLFYAGLVMYARSFLAPCFLPIIAAVIFICIRLSALVRLTQRPEYPAGKESAPLCYALTLPAGGALTSPAGVVGCRVRCATDLAQLR